MTYLFGIAIFLSAALLFIMELLYVKMVLPFLGGTPAVWNTCSVFFQFALLAGYIYAHYSASKLKIKAQVFIHIILLALPLLLLPVVIPESWRNSATDYPVFWLLSLMVISVGLPFVVISTSSPLLQKWFSYTGHKDAADPYFLYASSNAGSFAGLIGYLILIEPHLTLANQNKYWMYSYIMLAIFIAVCGLMILNLRKNTESELDQSSDPQINEQPVSFLRKLRWVVLAFIPSSLMLGLTTHLTTDIASVPFLWVIPLGLYLLSFVIVFSRKYRVSQNILIKLLPIFVIIQTVVLTGAPLKLIWLIFVPLPTFLVAAVACHRELVLDRPSSSQLTLFYLLMSVGGMFGGIFNALIAPVIFNSIAEYPIMLVAACIVCLLPRNISDTNEWKRSLRIGYMDSVSILGISAFMFLFLYFISRNNYSMDSIQASIGLGIAAIICYLTVNYPLRFGIVLGIILMILHLDLFETNTVIYKNRSFFGVIKVEYEPYSNTNRLIHGTTLHGSQKRDSQYRGIPLTYYYNNGPIGKLFYSFSGDAVKKDVAVVGLGSGSIAAYMGQGQHIAFYEIDENIRNIALDNNYFTYLSDAKARGAKVDVVIGDARVRLSEVPNAAYDIIVLDAFSSDSIPTHLCTREALRIYLTKLKDNGIIVYHLSNRYLKLDKVFSNLVIDSGLTALIYNDYNIIDFDEQFGKTESSWLAAAREFSDFKELANDPGWFPAVYHNETAVWTDDFSNIAAVLK